MNYKNFTKELSNKIIVENVQENKIMILRYKTQLYIKVEIIGNENIVGYDYYAKIDE